jgi:hypothetical protein
VRRLEITVEEGLARIGALSGEWATVCEGYVDLVPGQTMRWPVGQGAYVYSMAPGGKGRGCVYRLVAPSVEEGGETAVVGQEGLFDGSKQARDQAALLLFHFSSRARRWRPAPRALWDVGEFVEMVSCKGGVVRVTFDYERANASIIACGGGVLEATDWSWHAGWDSPAPLGNVAGVQSYVGGSGGYVPYVGSVSPSGGSDAGGASAEVPSGQMERLQLSPAREVRAELQAAGGAGQVYYGLRTDERGEGGVYVDWEAVALRVEGERG